MAGLVGPFLDAANRVTSVSVIAHGRTLAHVRFAPEQSPYPFIAMVPQDVTEKLLAGELRRRGRAVEYQTTFVSAEERGNGVRVTLEHDGRRAEATAAFVVGCDGAHSTVRHLLNLPFEGAQYEDLFLLADAQTNEALPADELQLCPSEFGPAAIFPMSATRRRIVATVDQPEGDAPSIELVRSILKQRAPAEIEVRSIAWSSYFRIHHRQVANLRVGRMFVAGDAAHIHSPFGGQGMNTGLMDVWNLAWKLDLALRNRGNERLLDSYTAERRPVIKDVIETTDRLTRAMGTPNRFAQALRDTIIPVLSHLTPFQHAFVNRLSGLGIAYGGSPIIEGDGERYLDDSLRGGEGIRSRFLLLVDDGADAATREAARQLAESFHGVLELRPRPLQGIGLVRPDGYVAFSTRHHDGVAALKSVRTLLESVVE
jgi:2-polyprenyl-6-methoxyphenol hydroxylase-like FAD-dependent oxidoreductase